MLVSKSVNRLIDEAAKVSVGRSCPFIGVEHLFEAIMLHSQSLPESFREEFDAALVAIAESLDSNRWFSTDLPTESEPRFTPRCVAATRDANRIAQQFRSPEANAAHLLLALLRDPDSAPSRTASRLSLPRHAMVRALADAIVSSQVIESSSSGGGPGPNPPGGDRTEQTAGESEVNLNAFITDLTARARAGELTPAYGRDREIRQIAEILSRKEKANLVLVGEPGVGKSRIVEGLAAEIAAGSLATLVRARTVLELNVASLLAGTTYRGTFEKRLTSLLKELDSADDTLLFIDEMHLIMGAGATDGDALDLANLLKPALSRGRIRCIGATTIDEYSRTIARDPAMSRRFQHYTIEELSPNDTYNLLKAMTDEFERHHGVTIGRGTVTAAVKVAERFLSGRQFPDKAIDVLDQACARFHLKMVLAATNPEALEGTVHPADSLTVTPHDIHKVISQMTGIPVESLNNAERNQLQHLERSLGKEIIGQGDAIDRVVRQIQKARAGMADPNRPRAVMLFLGPTGVGKTELTKALARQLFGSKDALARFDMSDFTEEHAISKLIGSPPGYAGSEEDGRLYAALARSPHTILLFDEIEKAHPKILDVFLPILEEGRLKDARGRELDFRNTYIIFTSNVAASLAGDDAEGTDDRLHAEMQRHFRREFINRIDEIVPFRTLGSKDVYQILRRMVRNVRKRLEDQGIGIRMHRSAYEWLARRGYSQEYGARELRRMVDRHIAEPIAKMLIDQKIEQGDAVEIRRSGKELAYAPRRARESTR